MKKLLLLILFAGSVTQLSAMDKNKEIQSLRKEINSLKKQVLILRINLKHVIANQEVLSDYDEITKALLDDDFYYSEALPLDISSSGNVFLRDEDSLDEIFLKKD